jgi:hypothetical protein
MKKSSRILRIASRLTIVYGVLVSGSFAWADATAPGTCSDGTLRGSYGFAIEGVLVPGPGAAIPIRGVAITNFDGQGHLTQADHVVVPGFPPPVLDWTPGMGTYHVNSDCTGTAHIATPSTGEFVNLRFVVVSQGKEIHTVVVPPFDLGGVERTVTSVGIKTE